MNLPFDVNLKNKEPPVAADSGIVLWRKNFAYFIVYFAIPFWICAFLLRLLPGNLQYLSWAVLWYLKPLFDRSILHVISIRFFAPNADLKQISPGFFKNLLRGLPGDLLWRRFSPFRAVFMPMRVLEKKNKSERKKLLSKGGAGYCFLLTIWGLSVEAALLAGEFLFIMIMSQIIGGGYLGFEDDFFLKSEIYFFALWCLNYILVESIYICMGFGVYINSRIIIEGWDIEKQFKSFAEKLKKKKELGSLTMKMVMLFLVFSALMPAKVFSEDAVEAKPYTQYDDAPIEVLEGILSSPDFGSSRNTWRIRLKNPPKERDNSPAIDRSKINSFLKALEYILASGLRIILVILAAVFAVVLLIFIRRYIKKRRFAGEFKPEVGIADAEQQKDPNELLNKAVHYYNQGNPANHCSPNTAYLRLSWGYITAALILSLQLFRGFVFPPNATENDCAKIIKTKKENINPVISEQICAILKIWINFAYAGMLPPDGKFEESVSLCRSIISSQAGGNNG